MTKAFVGIDVAFAKRKRLPVCICVREHQRLRVVSLRSRDLPKPPIGRGNRAVLGPVEVRQFALEALGYLRMVEQRLGLAVQVVSLDCPRQPRVDGSPRRMADHAMDERGIKCFTTPSKSDFTKIRNTVRRFLRDGGAESRMPHANQLWMLVGFELFKIFEKHYECREVFPQAIVATLGCATYHKSTLLGYASQLEAAASVTGYSVEELARDLTGVYGSRHDRIDAFLSAWIASLDISDLEACGVPPWDVIWIPRVERPGVIETLRNGFGFIRPDSGERPYFFHASGVFGLFKELRENQAVTFQAVASGRGGLKADRVHLQVRHKLLPTVLAFKIREDGSIAVQVQTPDGSWVYADGTFRVPSGLYGATFVGLAQTLGELEDLINSAGVSEDELQSFFERHPELLRGVDYSVVIPQAIISSEENIHWRADFVLKPIDELDFCRILELKLPQMSTLRNTRSGHSQFYAELLDAISQLRDYGEAFNSERTRTLFKEKYGVDVYKPELQLIAGRRWELIHRRRLLELQRRSGVHITDWDAHLEALKRRFGIAR